MHKRMSLALLFSLTLNTAVVASEPRISYAQFASSRDNVPFWKKIGKFSWGPLKSVLPQSCDGDGGIAGHAAGSIARDLIGAIGSLVERNMVMDDVLLTEGLQDQFKVIADIGMPVVWIVDRNPDEIIFAYSLGLVQHDEVFAAAKKYCGYDKRKPVYEGSSRHCTPMRDMKKLHFTYVISAFRCAD